MRIEEQGRQDQRQAERRVPGGTSEEILTEIRDFCRATRTAESTFGRLVVNDGKLVSRLRDGAKITPGALERARAYLSDHRPAPTSGKRLDRSGVVARHGRDLRDRHRTARIP